MTKLKKTPPPFSARDWVPLKAALRRIMSITESYSRGLHYLTRDLRSGQLRSALEEISPDGKEMHTLLNPSDWRERTIYAEINPENGVWVKPYVVGDIFVCRVDLDEWYPIAATPTMTTEAHPSDDTRPQERRRGPVLKHEWHAIDGEIARRCINPKTRLLKIPKSERKLAKDILGWCQEKYDKEPAESEMREAVKAICAALRAHK